MYYVWSSVDWVVPYENLKAKEKQWSLRFYSLENCWLYLVCEIVKFNFTGSSQGEASYSELQTMQRPPNTIPQIPPGIKITALEWIFLLLSFGIFSNKLLITCTDVFLVHNLFNLLFHYIFVSRISL